MQLLNNTIISGKGKGGGEKEKDGLKVMLEGSAELEIIVRTLIL